MQRIETKSLHKGVAGARHTFLPQSAGQNKLDLLLQVLAALCPLLLPVLQSRCTQIAQPRLPDVDAPCKLQQPAPCQPCSLQPASLALSSVPSCSNLQSGFRVQTLTFNLPAWLLCLLQAAAAYNLPALLSCSLHICHSVGTSDRHALMIYMFQCWKHVLVRSF